MTFDDIAHFLGYGQSGQSPPGDTPDLAQDGPITDPSQVDPSFATPAPAPVTPAPATPGQSGLVEIGAKQASSGFDQGKYNQVTATQKPMEKKISKDTQEVMDEYAPIQKGLTSAAEDAKKAEDAAAVAEGHKIRIESEKKARLAQTYAEFKNHEENAYAQARLEAEGYKADYRAALMDYRGSQVNPAQLWEASGKGGQFGLMASAFVHDFLGAQGIKTSAMDNINLAISRNIDSQVEAIRRKGEVAQGFKSLWDMQRAQSASDAEARERMRGFYLQALDSEFDSRMGQYDSDLATAKHAAAKAKIQEEMLKNQEAVMTHIDAAVNRKAELRTQQRGQDLQYAQVKLETDARVKIADINAKADVAKSNGVAPVLYDLTESGVASTGGKGAPARWRFKPEWLSHKELVEDVSKKHIATSLAVKDFKELLDLQEKAKSLPDGVPNRFLDELQRREEAVRSRIKLALTLDATGKASNEQEQKAVNQMLPANTWLTNGNNIAIISDRLKAKIGEDSANLQTYTNNIGDDDPDAGKFAPPSGFAAGEDAMADVNMSDNNGKAQDTSTDKSVQMINSPDSRSAPKRKDIETAEAISTTGGATDLPDEHWKQFTTQFPEFSTNTVKGGKSSTPTPYGSISTDLPDRKEKQDMPRSFVGFEGLGNKAQEGDKHAVEQLQAWADVYLGKTTSAPDASDPNSEDAQFKGAMALWELNKLQEKESKTSKNAQ
jgi:hypothetical protein